MGYAGEFRMRHFLRVLLDPVIAVGLVAILPTRRDGPAFVCSGRIGRGQSLSSGAAFFEGNLQLHFPLQS